jgi:hypothetical protein
MLFPSLIVLFNSHTCADINYLLASSLPLLLILSTLMWRHQVLTRHIQNCGFVRLSKGVKINSLAQPFSVMS